MGATGPGATISIYGSEIGTGTISAINAGTYYQVPFTATGVYSNTTSSSYNLVMGAAGIVEVTGIVSVTLPGSATTADTVSLTLQQNGMIIGITTLAAAIDQTIAGAGAIVVLTVQSIISCAVNDTFGLWITDNTNSSISLVVNSSSPDSNERWRYSGRKLEQLAHQGAVEVVEMV